MFPLTDVRGRIVGFQARKLRDDDPMRGEVRELGGGRALPEGRLSTGCTSRGGYRASRIAPSSSRETPT